LPNAKQYLNEKRKREGPLLSSPFTGRKRKEKEEKKGEKKHIKNVGATKKVVE